MAVSAFVYPSFIDALNAKTVAVTTDTLKVMLISAGTYTWNTTSQAHVHVSDFLAGSGAGAMTETSTSGTGYTRQTLATVATSDVFSTPHTYTSLTVSTAPNWTSASFSTTYAVFFDNTIGGTDSTNQLVAYWDLGGTQTVTASTFTLSLATANTVANTLVQWTSN